MNVEARSTVVREAALWEGAPTVPALLSWCLIVFSAVIYSYDTEYESTQLMLLGWVVGLLSLARGIGWWAIGRRIVAALVFLSQFGFMLAWLAAFLAWFAKTECQGCSSSDGETEMLWLWLATIVIIATPIVSVAALLLVCRYKPSQRLLSLPPMASQV
jgi:hypothetical protein